jgi:glutathione S-transferase
MAMRFYFHPLSSYCHKALIALYENDIPFEPQVVNLQDPAERAALAALWPMAKFPVLRDEARDRTIPESTVIIEYLAQHYPGKVELIPPDPDLARETRARDRFLDLYLHNPMQKVIGDRMRPEGRKDPTGVAEALATIQTALGVLEPEMAGREWAMGEHFSLADCAAAPPLYFITNHVRSFRDTHPNVTRYLERVQQRPSYARVLREAEPYLGWVPK